MATLLVFKEASLCPHLFHNHITYLKMISNSSSETGGQPMFFVISRCHIASFSLPVSVWQITRKQRLTCWERVFACWKLPVAKWRSQAAVPSGCFQRANTMEVLAIAAVWLVTIQGGLRKYVLFSWHFPCSSHAHWLHETPRGHPGGTGSWQVRLEKLAGGSLESRAGYGAWPSTAHSEHPLPVFEQEGIMI